MPPERKSASGRILHNSFWYGLEIALETIVFFGTSVAVARYLGPQKLGYFSYINFFVITITRTSGTGLASATRKYMAEFLARDEPGKARAVYWLAYRYQLTGAIIITVLGLAAVLLFGDPAFRVMACILIIAVTPGVMSQIPAMANIAFEDSSKNTISAFGYLVSYAVVIGLTLHFHWDLVGVASATLVGRIVEVTMRTIPLNRKLATLPLDVLGSELKQRIKRFCIQALGVQLIMSVVWDRSEMLFLKHFCSLEQISFYGVSIGLANNLLLLPRTFGAGTGVTLMVEAVRDPGRVDSIVKNATRYLLLVVFPIHLGAAAITAEAIRFVYGTKYLAAIPVMIIATLLCIPRAFQETGEVLLKAADQQRKLLIWLGITAVVNLSLDWYLIPRYGAVGAAWGNGLGQTFGIVVVWQAARRCYRFGFPAWTAVRLAFAASVMAVVAWSISRSIPGLPGLIAAVATAVPLYLVLVKLLHGLQPSDRSRLAPIGNRLPGGMKRAYLAMVSFITPVGA